MEVSDRIVIFSKGDLEQIGSPREVYEQPANEFVARFIGVMNVIECEVINGLARCNELEFPSHGAVSGQKLRIGFRPYSVQISPDMNAYRYRGILRHTYFLGIMLRLEIELPSGLILRSRMTKEQYGELGLADNMPVSFQIRHYRVLATEGETLSPEVATTHEIPAYLGAGI